MFVLPRIRLATMRYSGPYGAPLTRFLQSFDEARFARGWNGETYGVAIPGEQYVAKFTDPQRPEAHMCSFDAGVSVAADAVIDSAFAEATLQGGRYAIFEFSGASESIGEAWEAALRTQYEVGAVSEDGRPPFEWYRAKDRVYADRRFSCALCVPMR